jgi:hypothetical protein
MDKRRCKSLKRVILLSGQLKTGTSMQFIQRFCITTLWVLFPLMIAAQITPKNYTAYKAIDIIQVDGQPNEASWALAKWTDSFIDIEGVKTPSYHTQLKMLWDDKYLYFLAKLEEPHVWGDISKRDEVIFYNNDFEIFIDPDGDTHNYYELEINALNTAWDLFLTKPYRNGPKVIDSWDIQGLQSAISVNGTLNNPNDTDQGWMLEVAIPWKVIAEASNSSKPPVNEFWRLNFSRVNWDFDLVNNKYQRKKDSHTNKYLPEYNWVWSPQGVINMHEPEKWGYVFFSKEKVGGKKTDFEIPKDEHIKWYMYKLYRAQLSIQKEKKFKGKDIIKYPTQTMFGKAVRPQFEQEKYGWHIWVKSPFTNKLLIIKEDGKFLSYDQNK